MKNLKNKLWAKITALLLLMVFAVLAFFGIIGSAYLIATDSYLDNGRAMRQEINEGLMRDSIYDSMHFMRLLCKMRAMATPKSWRISKNGMPATTLT